MKSISDVNSNEIAVSDPNNDETAVRSLDEGNIELQYYVSKAPRRAPIKMMYRGSTYYHDPEQARANRQTHPINQAPYDLIYRGVTYRIDPNEPKPPATTPRNYELMYRGCTYRITRDAAGAVMVINPE
jgi:hypothetical protein